MLTSLVWIWGADMHCDACHDAGKLDGPDCDGNEAESYDPDYQECDSPAHCGTCGAFLGLGLTEYGHKWLREKLAGVPRNEEHAALLDEWRTFYAINEEEPDTHV